MNITEFRQKYPEYDDIQDDALTKSLHSKHYSDMPYEEFSAKFLAKPKEKSLPELAAPYMFPALSQKEPAGYTRQMLSKEDKTGEIGGAMLGGFAGGLPGAAIGAGMANQGKKFLNQWMFGQDPGPMSQQLMEAGTEAAYGGATEFQGIAKLMQQARLGKAYKPFIESVNRISPELSRGAQVAQDQGLPLRRSTVAPSKKAAFLEIVSDYTLGGKARFTQQAQKLQTRLVDMAKEYKGKLPFRGKTLDDMEGAVTDRYKEFEEFLGKSVKRTAKKETPMRFNLYRHSKDGTRSFVDTVDIDSATGQITKFRDPNMQKIIGTQKLGKGDIFDSSAEAMGKNEGFVAIKQNKLPAKVGIDMNATWQAIEEYTHDLKSDEAFKLFKHYSNKGPIWTAEEVNSFQSQLAPIWKDNPELRKWIDTTLAIDLSKVADDTGTTGWDMLVKGKEAFKDVTKFKNAEYVENLLTWTIDPKTGYFMPSKYVIYFERNAPKIKKMVTPEVYKNLEDFYEVNKLAAIDIRKSALATGSGAAQFGQLVDLGRSIATGSLQDVAINVGGQGAAAWMASSLTNPAQGVAKMSPTFLNELFRQAGRTGVVQNKPGPFNFPDFQTR